MSCSPYDMLIYNKFLTLPQYKEINRFLNYEEPSKTIMELIELSDPDFDKKTIFIFPEGVLTNIYLEDLKNRINQSRTTSSLFDTKRFTGKILELN